MRVRRPAILVSVVALALLVVAVPALAGGGKSNAPGQQKAKEPSTPITISGVVESSVDADGESDYTLTDGGKTYILEAGPKWFFDEGAYPLDKYVGKDVTIDGELGKDNRVDVLKVDGVTIREPGRPPWAGGWKAVGEKHPGWSQEKADRFKARFGDCFPPGQCKDKPGHSDDPNDTEDDPSD